MGRNSRIGESFCEKWARESAHRRRKNGEYLKRINQETEMLVRMFKLASRMQKTRFQNVKLRAQLQNEIDSGREIYLRPRLRSLHLYQLKTYGVRRAVYGVKKLLDDQRAVYCANFPDLKFNDIPPGVYPSKGTYMKAINLNSQAIAKYMQMRSARRIVGRLMD